MKLPKTKKRNYYRYLCGVAESMNIDFRYSGSSDKAIVVSMDGKLKIIILRKVDYNLYTIKESK